MPLHYQFAEVGKLIGNYEAAYHFPDLRKMITQREKTLLESFF